MSGDTIATLGLILVTLLLISGNALYVFHEFAFVRLRQPQIREIERSGSRIDHLVVKMARQLDHYIAVDQLGITITSIAVGWVGQPVAAQLMRSGFDALGLPVSRGAVTGVSFGIAFILITAMQMILGELIPKTVALRSARRTASLVALPVEASAWLLHPIVVVLNGAGNILVRLLGVTPGSEGHSQVLPPDELEAVIRASARAGLAPGDPTAIRQALHFSDLKASDLTVPRQEMITLDISMTVDEVIEIAREHRLTRYPVVDGSLDQVSGILNVKELFEIDDDGTTRIVTDWRQLVQPALILPEQASIEAVLQAMMRENQHLVLLADDFGGIDGMFTISDISRMITGSPKDIVAVSDGVYSIDGTAAVNVVENYLDLSLGPDTDERDYESIGGLIMAQLGRIPEVGDEIEIDGHTLRVTRMDGLRILQVTLEINDERSLA